MKTSLEQIITSWALFGGLLLILVVCVNGYSIVASALWNKPFPGDFELTQLGVAIAAFCFLPYVQMLGANVSADIFTMKARPAVIHAFNLLAGIVAILISVTLLWRMGAGMQSYIKYPEVTGVLEIPIWWAFPPILVSLALWVSASCLSCYKLWRN